MRIWLIAASILAIVAVNAVLALVLTRSVTDSLLMREGQVAQEFLNSIVAGEGTADRLFSPADQGAALASFGMHVRRLPGTIRANIYSPDGFIRQSTEPDLLGLQFRDNEELASSFKGQIIAKLEEVNVSGKSEHLALNRMAGEEVVEAYIPVNGPGGGVVAVVEFYRSAEVIRTTVQSIGRTIWIAAGVSGLILLLALGGLVLAGRRFGRV
jgi:hypothetical protein